MPGGPRFSDKGPRLIRRAAMAVPISPERVLTRTIPNATNQIVPHGASKWPLRVLHDPRRLDVFLIPSMCHKQN